VALVQLSLGSNIGRRGYHLSLAAARLALAHGVELLRLSPVYETAPWGDTEQSAFYNMAASIRCALSPPRLLALAKSIEVDLGRRATRHWGPRVIDIDIILFEGVAMRDATLTLPHPHASERQFVLVPLHSIAPEAQLAPGVSVSQLARQDDPAVWFIGSLHQVLERERRG
jgi:2-amino-4-hydroxy-6-hydroxymethyldihydropteridine diphosphokinase